MKLEDLKLVCGENSFQTADIEKNEKTIDYETNTQLSYLDILSLVKGLNVVSEFYDVKAAVAVKGTGIVAVALGKTLADAVTKIMDSNPVDFMNSTISLSSEVDSETARFFRKTNLISAPKYTKNSLEILETHNVKYVTIHTPLKDYKQYLSNEIKITPLGTLTQTPNLSELNKDTFKIVTSNKPTVEQIEDAVFAWKVAKHNTSQSIVIAKDLKTLAVSQGLQSASVEFALDYSCDMSKDAVLASDLPLTIHDINVAAQGRIGTIIVPFAQKDVITSADKYNMSLITTGFSNILY